MSFPVKAVPQSTISEVSALGSHGSRWSDIRRAAGKVLAAPFRTASTLVNAGVFGAYYVTTMAISGLVLTGSALVAPVRMIADLSLGRIHEKRVADYVVSPAKKTFNFISRLYDELPKHAPEFIFSGVGIVAVAAVTIYSVARKDAGGDQPFRGETRVHFHFYDQSGEPHHPVGAERRHDDSDDGSYFMRMLRPYKISIDAGAAIMGRTSRLVNGPRTIP